MPDPGYYANDRADVLARLPRPVGRVLDVGCGGGATASGLRSAGATELVGIEMMPEPAARAREVLDRVIEGTVEQAFEEELGEFDTILCLDVLEHLVDSAGVVEGLRTLSRPGGTLFISVPNARHFSLAKDLVLHGTFGYGEWGHRDRTHLRWFTSRDLTAMVTAAGWVVDEIAWPPLGRSRYLHKLTRGKSSELLVAQVYLRAHSPQ